MSRALDGAKPVQVNHLLKGFVDNAKGAPASARHTLAEVTGIYVCLNQLGAFLSGRQESSRSRRSLVMIEQVVIVFTDCVAIFSELEQTLESLKTDTSMRVIDRVKWAMKEKTISKLLTRLQTSKASLSLMLNILSCNSMETAETSTKDLTTLVQQLLKSNINMSRRLRNIEKMHPAMNQSTCPSLTSEILERHASRLIDPSQASGTPFEKELETSPVYKRAAFNKLQASQSSSNAASGPSFLSGLSLSDVSNVTAMALPISSTELWNHHRYPERRGSSTSNGVSTLDAWYYPPPRRSAFIRTVYFNGQYTNQYAQAKCTGHLIYRRFSVNSPDRPPRFKEGWAIPASTDQDQPCDVKEDGNEERAELEDTSPCELMGHCYSQCREDRTRELEQQYIDIIFASYWGPDSSSDWGQGVRRLLESVGK
ncbi:MAG: hypothetical protein Q9181_003646 [Wetmoreana brouardii]